MTNPIVQEPNSPDLKQVLWRLELGKRLDTLPERVTPTLHGRYATIIIVT